ncbi:hypothetical protein BS78_08G123400 [Paspalum vaginatum]|nr:hypothetical protein BS78_08G123400 [Paspalum vaginatum]
MSAAAEEQVIVVPPAYKFRPTDRELVKHYLLPRARGENPFPGVIAEDDTAGSTLPWELFARHGLGHEEQAHFIVRGSDDKKPGARQDRGCVGGVGTWKKQNKDDMCFRIGGEGETVRCTRSNFNLHMGKGEDGGSVGWVMHEYTIAAPPCPLNVRICHVAFTGHGRKRKRVPDGQEAAGRQQKSARADAAVVPIYGSAAPPCSGEMAGHQLRAMCADGSEQLPPLVLTDGGDNFPQSHLHLGGVHDSSDSVGVPCVASALANAQVPTPDTDRKLEELSETEIWEEMGIDVSLL